MAYRLKIEIHGYWHSGTGKGEGAVYDAVAQKDRHGLPYLPGKTIKGLVRDAVCRREAWEHAEVPKGTTPRLFGTIAQTEGRQRTATEPGALGFGDAVLEPDLHNWLAEKKQAAQRNALYYPLYATAIDPASGTAKDKSLRGIEVAIPLTLYAELEEISPLQPADWEIIKTSLPLIRAVGTGRTRGLGRATITLLSEPQTTADYSDDAD